MKKHAIEDPLGWHSLGVSFDCACGVRHALPIEACYVGERAAEKLAGFARGRCGARCLVVSDETTREAGGERLLSALGVHHAEITEKIFPGAGAEATEERALEVAAAGAEADFYVAIGSGTWPTWPRARVPARKSPCCSTPRPPR